MFPECEPAACGRAPARPTTTVFSEASVLTAPFLLRLGPRPSFFLLYRIATALLEWCLDNIDLCKNEICLLENV